MHQKERVDGNREERLHDEGVDCDRLVNVTNGKGAQLYIPLV